MCAGPGQAGVYVVMRLIYTMPTTTVFHWKVNGRELYGVDKPSLVDPCET